MTSFPRTVVFFFFLSLVDVRSHNTVLEGLPAESIYTSQLHYTGSGVTVASQTNLQIHRAKVATEVWAEVLAVTFDANNACFQIESALEPLPGVSVDKYGRRVPNTANVYRQ